MKLNKHCRQSVDNNTSVLLLNGSTFGRDRPGSRVVSTVKIAGPCWTTATYLLTAYVTLSVLWVLLAIEHPFRDSSMNRTINRTCDIPAPIVHLASSLSCEATKSREENTPQQGKKGQNHMFSMEYRHRSSGGRCWAERK